MIDGLERTPLGPQRIKIHNILKGFIEHKLEAIILNGEMGTGKTYVSIATAAIYHKYNPKPIFVICPPHLVYKWRREILSTIQNAKVTVINGSDAINKLLKLREQVLNKTLDNTIPQFIVIGRVRMRMGFHWKPAYTIRKIHSITTLNNSEKVSHTDEYIACSHCGDFFIDSDKNFVDVNRFTDEFSNDQQYCSKCSNPLWTMHHRANTGNDNKELQLIKFLQKLPGIGKVTAQKMVQQFGVEQLTSIIDDNIYEFVNLYDPEKQGEFYFTDKHAKRIERSLGRLEFALRFISYQPSEFIKRYFPRKFFGLAIADEAHEYKNSGSAQGQAMAVLCSASDQVLPLTGTLMGGYASDLFHLLWRIMPSFMRSQGFSANQSNSLGTAEMDFMRRYGVLIDVIKTTNGPAHKTAKGNQTRTSVKKAPGFSPMGIAKHILPFTVFMKLNDFGNELPAYTENTHTVSLPADMQKYYKDLEDKLIGIMREAIRKKDNSLIGLVMTFLLRWTDTAFREEVLYHPKTKKPLVNVRHHFDENRPMPKEQDCIDLCLAQKQQNRKVIIYTTYTGKHDTMTRLKGFLENKGLNVAVLRSNVKTDEREDWIADKVEQNIDVLITNPELVKTGLDLFAFPTLYFMQTGTNTYTLEQASRRSWRLGQKNDVEVYFSCYDSTSQTKCLSLMSNKIKVSQSTSGVMPETGLDVFDEEADNSILFEMAKDLVKAHRNI
ncbi:SNF2-related protein [Pasteurella atlantica]|uniref:SNF2-related protein n=1 Tax=Pasteurellaceae TaxID=712 RepID=UPI00278C4757|nr:SNF2-related protein [Pasteurella atlantica]